MATFSPFGLQGDLSTSAASQANPTLLTFPWNPAFSGWSGDPVISYLPAVAGTNVSSALGYVYPAFISSNITIPNTVQNIYYPPIVGVIVGFKYKPANNSLTPNDTWPSYDKTTVLQEGTTVQVIVNTDAQARYKIQYRGEPGLPGISQDYFLGCAQFGGDPADQYTQTVGTVDFVFVKGTPNTSTASAQGLLPGTSRICLTSPQSINDILLQENYTRPPSNPLLILTPNNYDNSGWWSDTDPDDTNENNIVGVMFNQSFINSNAVSIYEQKVLTS
jgi:hypothetical protein